jgi:chitin disaccharide deacetylase
MRAAPIAITLCADDYAIAPGTSAAIRRLLALGRLSATSCMSLAPRWPEEGAALRPFRGAADIGLHFTLTEFSPLGPMPRLAPGNTFLPLRRIGRAAFLGSLDRREIEDELNRQLDRFEQALGGPPDFIDGHHHIHQFPVVRDAVLGVVQRRFARGAVYLRSCAEPVAAILRRRIAPAQALVLATMGHVLRRAARRAGVPTNASFRGVRSFAEPRYEPLFERFLHGLVPGSLIMCHPGSDDDPSDEIAAARAQEFAFFSGPQFPAMLAAGSASMGRFRTTA